MSVTLEVSHFDTSGTKHNICELFPYKANIPDISVTLEVSHFDTSGTWFNVVDSSS